MKKTETKKYVKNIAKEELVKLFGDLAVFEVCSHPVGIDYMVIMGGNLVKVVKVMVSEEIVDFKAHSKELKAYQKKVIDFSKNNHIPVEIWTYEPLKFTDKSYKNYKKFVDMI